MTRRTARHLAELALAFVAVMAAFSPFFVIVTIGLIREAR